MSELLFVSQVNDWDEVVYTPTALGYTVIVALCVLFLAAAFVLARKAVGRNITTRQIVFSGVAIALATVLSGVKIFKMPWGGSVTLCSMLFVTLIGFWYGPAAGLLTGVAHGLLQLVLGSAVYSLPQLVVDYPLAFGALGLSGFFWKAKHGLVKGYLAGVAGRYVFAVLSGWIFFGIYAWEGWDPLPYSLAYNAAYIAAEAAITLIIIALPPVEKGLIEIKKIALAEK